MGSLWKEVDIQVGEAGSRIAGGRGNGLSETETPCEERLHVGRDGRGVWGGGGGLVKFL